MSTTATAPMTMPAVAPLDGLEEESESESAAVPVAVAVASESVVPVVAVASEVSVSVEPEVWVSELSPAVVVGVGESAAPRTTTMGLEISPSDELVAPDARNWKDQNALLVSWSLEMSTFQSTDWVSLTFMPSVWMAC